MSFAREKATSYARLRQAANFQVESLERRVLLSSAIAAFRLTGQLQAAPSPRCIAVADVNGDGKPDIITGDTSGDISVFLGNGNGTFQAQQFFPAHYQPVGIAVADLNGDGRPDVVVANIIGIDVFLGNGNGTFQPAQVIATQNHPYAVAVADMNGDGKPDLVFGGGSEVGILLGNGNGTFAPANVFVGGTFGGIAVTDFNADGKLDLAFASNYGSGTATVLLGNGNGTFQNRQTFAAGLGAFALTACDLNGDGHQDLAVVNGGSAAVHGDTVSILLGNGNGTFQPQQTFTVGSYPHAIAAADVNGDGKTDLVIADSYTGGVSVLLGNGNGTFQGQQVFLTGSSPFGVAIADLNDDGRADVVTANLGSGNVGVLIGDVPPTVLSINRTSPPGPITSDSGVSYTVTFNETVSGVDPTDFVLTMTGNVSATSPVVVTPVNGALYTVTINGITGTGTLGLNLVDDGSIKDAAGNPLQPGGVASFQQPQTFATGSGTRSVVVSDVNGDGRPDLVVTNEFYNNVGVLLGNGNGTFQSERTFAAGTLPYSIAVADVNGDGRPDIVAGDDSANPGSVKVLLGNGDGTFQPARTFTVGWYPRCVAIADINSDGKPDLIVGNYHVNSVSILLGNGNGTFQSQTTLAAGTNPRAVTTADVNGDGTLDLIITDRTGTVNVLLGNGNGTFRPALSFTAGSNLYSVAVTDLNGDGKLDIAVANRLVSGNVGVLLGNGDGTFKAVQTFAAGPGPGFVAVGDLNLDGKPDLVVDYNGGGNYIGTLLGNGSGTFHAQQSFVTGASSYSDSLAIADVNGDGRPDLIVADTSSQRVGILLAGSSANATGPRYTLVPNSDNISGTSGADQITLAQNPDNQHIDWTLNGSMSEISISDPNGLTITGNGGNDTIALDYTNGDPLPETLHLNGTFIINGLQGTNPLAGTTMDIGRSTLFISYGNDPIATIQSYLHNGYNASAWNGTPTATTGVITSAAAAANPNHNTGIGYGDWADGQSVNTMTNTIELTYTLYGDANLDHQVNSADLQILLFNLNHPGAWDQGDFNYDAQVNSADLQNLLFTLNTSLGNQATPMAVAAAPVAGAPASGSSSGSDPSSHLMPAINTAGSSTTPLHHPHPAKPAARKRR